MCGGVVGEDPGEHGVLHQVVGGPPRQTVQLRQVLEVAVPALPPFFREILQEIALWVEANSVLEHVLDKVLPVLLTLEHDQVVFTRLEKKL